MQEFDQNQTALDFDSDLSEAFVCANTARALEIRTEDIKNKLLTTTQYRQDYPYIGRASRTIVQNLVDTISDPVCLTNPLDSSCFEEPPPNCGPLLYPISESRTPLSENADGSLRSLASAPGYRFMSFVDPVITDAIRLYTSTPAFVAAKQQRIMAYANNSTELRDDLATSAQTQCAPLVPIAWVMSRKRWRSCV